MIGHVAPEGVGGPLAAVQEGDTIVIDTAARRLDVDLSDDEIAKRLGTWSPAPKYDRGVLAKYAALVTQADNGAIMRVGFEPSQTTRRQDGGRPGRGDPPRSSCMGEAFEVKEWCGHGEEIARDDFGKGEGILAT